MLSKEELIKHPEYWMEKIQNEIYRELVTYMEKEGLNRKELAKRLGVSKGYVSQILNGDCNFSLKKLIKLALAIDKFPVFNFSFDNPYEKAHKPGGTLKTYRSNYFVLPYKHTDSYELAVNESVNIYTEKQLNEKSSAYKETTSIDTSNKKEYEKYAA
jgi:transcriptional regulator with XRE-family HTH domain